MDMLNNILMAVGVLTAISVGLAVLILIVDNTIGNYGECTIKINGGDKEIKVDGGQNLLSSLSSQGIFIPSACGGKGSCGLCTLKVCSGAGDFLPTELPWLTADQKKDNIRLSCQIKVKNDMEIEVPEEYFNVKEYETKIDSIVDLTHDIKQVRFKLPEGETINFKAGQFVQIQVPEYELTDESVYRAYSISSAVTQKDEVELMIRLVPNGICTTYVHNYLKEGDDMTVTGPYGHFYLQEDTEREIICIAGGSGMAPIKSILHRMEQNNINRRCRYFFGAQGVKDLFSHDDMASFEKSIPNFKYLPALSSPADEDNWQGETGLITNVVDAHMKEGEGANTEAYLCGSPGMIDACIKVLMANGVPEELIYYDKF